MNKYTLTLNIKRQMPNDYPQFTINDTNQIEFIINDGSTLFTDYDRADITIIGLNTYPITDFTTMTHTFGGEITEAKDYQCELQLYNNGNRATTFKFRMTYLVDNSFPLATQPETQDIIATIYNDIDNLESTSLDHESRIQATESDLPNKLDKTTTTKQDVTAIVEFLNDLIVNGNLTVRGTTTSVDTVELRIEDNLIEINKNQTGTPLSTLLSGFFVNRGDLENYNFYFDESDDQFKIGKTNNLQPVATRESNPITNGEVIWDATNNRFKTVTPLPILTDLTLTESVTPHQLYGLAQLKSIIGATEEVNALLESVDNLTIKSVNENLFDKSTVTQGKYIKYDTGEILTSTSWVISDFIQIKSSYNYYFNSSYAPTTVAGVVFYDINKNYISGINYFTNTDITFVTPSNAVYLRLDIHDTKDINVVMLNTGTTPLPYTPHKSSQIQINETFTSHDKFIDGQKEVGGVTANLWELDFELSSLTYENHYRFENNSFTSDYNLDNQNFNLTIINTFDYNPIATDERHFFVDTRLVLFVEKSIINDIMTTQTLNEVNALKYYLDPITGIKGQFVGELATKTMVDVNVTGTLELYEGGTVYLLSDGIINDTVITVAGNDKGDVVILKNENKRQQREIDRIIAHLGI